jgi:cytochrome c7-like protein
MELLRRASRAPLTAALAMLACAGCMLVDALRAREHGLVFSHELHVAQEGLECVSCHESAEAEEAPGMPAPDSCAVCHDELDVERPPERAVALLFDGPSFRAARASQLADEVRFEHLAHVSAVGDCAACHRGIDTNRAVDASVAVDMEACQRCHQERAQPNECASCHSVIDRAWAPPDHAQDWRRLHGRACRRSDPAPAQDCSLCHADSTCEQCHRIEEPVSHDANFRLRGHAVLASIDRASCATCHESATCDRCHAEALPLSHRSASFGGTRSTHCLTCHFPLEGEGCLTCHKATPSHAATPKPDWHTPAMDCRSCHGSSLPLSHVDDGSNCNLCHP